MLVLLLGGCASFRTALVGPGPGLEVAGWDADGAHPIRVHSSGPPAMLSRADVARLGAVGEWALLDYQDASGPGTSSGVWVVRELRRVDGTDRFADLSTAIDRIRAEQVIAVAAHDADTEGALEALGFDEMPAAVMSVSAATYDGVRIRLTVQTSFVLTEMRNPCGGAPSPPVLTSLGGIAWARDYQIERDGAVSALGDVTRQTIPGPPFCDPRLP